MIREPISRSQGVSRRPSYDSYGVRPAELIQINVGHFSSFAENIASLLNSDYSERHATKSVFFTSSIFPDMLLSRLQRDFCTIALFIFSRRRAEKMPSFRS